MKSLEEQAKEIMDTFDFAGTLPLVRQPGYTLEGYDGTPDAAYLKSLAQQALDKAVKSGETSEVDGCVAQVESGKLRILFVVGGSLDSFIRKETK